MPDWLKAIIAGFTARKLGGGCLSTIFIFVIVYYALGQCNHAAPSHAKLNSSKSANQTVVAPAKP
jgi:hypothetical protein